MVVTGHIPDSISSGSRRADCTVRSPICRTSKETTPPTIIWAASICRVEAAAVVVEAVAICERVLEVTVLAVVDIVVVGAVRRVATLLLLLLLLVGPLRPLYISARSKSVSLGGMVKVLGWVEKVGIRKVTGVTKNHRKSQGEVTGKSQGKGSHLDMVDKGCDAPTNATESTESNPPNPPVPTPPEVGSPEGGSPIFIPILSLRNPDRARYDFFPNL